MPEFIAVTIRLLSWNVHGLPFLRGRRARLARWARELVDRAPSLVLLQELWLDKDAVALGRLLPARRYQLVGSPVTAGFRRGGLLTLVENGPGGWEVTEEVYEPFEANAPAWRVWEADGILGKGFQVIKLTGGERGRLTVVNTHLQAEYTTSIPGKRYVSIRRSQIEQLLRAVAAASREGWVLIAGDFNTVPEETALYGLLEEAGWIDLTAGLRAEHGGGTCVDTRETASEWLDYSFAVIPPGMRMSAGAALIRNTGRDVPFSDHHGLVVDVSGLNAAAC